MQHRTSQPLVHSVDEVAKILGISRGLAYQEARAYVVTKGRTGIPTIKIGCRYVVPAAALQEFLSISVPTHGVTHLRVVGGEDEARPTHQPANQSTNHETNRHER